MSLRSSFEALRIAAGAARLVLMTTAAPASFLDFAFRADDVILMGSESDGAPDAVHRSADARLRIPMARGLRSLNVVVAAAMVLGEAMRQTGLWPGRGRRRAMTLQETMITEVGPGDAGARATRARAWFDELRGGLVAAFEAIEADAPDDLYPGAPGRFELEPWVREAGGGGVMGFLHGRVFEKVGLHISEVHGRFTRRTWPQPCRAPTRTRASSPPG